ncbi:8-amino-7-oxononanoate synthase [Catenulispora sp. NF23]|uniref:8-amino-7-oxononanoate synthase n=1 Tax=Catenulispora pinistramenti TaxID=2705254 RepID=A0ABS5L3S7_9ACTN|nr:8-amino-7-oxononanoate synthase [Catenulispora pinistramenti]MBS2536818.1 8-amino-7-oxononanoate synthase [Catenulispora pinistramenti]MBS2552966.1 8-amino-7-oxononanoate synthase [Catenulispora pinistramenti]
MSTDDRPSYETQHHPLSWLALRADQRRAAGLRRTLVPRAADSALIDLAGNDYLGLTRHPEVVAATIEAVRRWGTGSTGSRLVTGTTELHAELEAELAAHAGTEAALVFSSGYLANLGVITALAGRGDLIVSDSLNHASLIDAARLSRARIAITPHSDVDAVAAALAGRAEERALVVVESLFSVDGDTAPLRELHEACRAHGAVLVVDEAHGFGVAGPEGRGAVFEAGLAGEPDVVVAATLSKALASQGGAVLGSAELIAHLVDAARSMIFDTGLAPAAAGAALAALRVIRRDPGLPETVRKRSWEIYELALELGLQVTAPSGAVTSIIMGAPEAAVAARDFCLERGLHVGCFRPPSVPDGKSRLRVTARADLSDFEAEQIRSVLSDLAAIPTQV